MVELAKASEHRQPLGIEYRVADARAIDYVAEFDLVIAAYLLNYAPSEQELFAMASAIHRSLRPGGRFITINNNLAQQPGSFENTRVLMREAYGWRSPKRNADSVHVHPAQ
jgi:toxoflavin synthase